MFQYFSKIEFYRDLVYKEERGSSREYFVEDGT
jgi:hypothetical protein